LYNLFIQKEIPMRKLVTALAAVAVLTAAGSVPADAGAKTVRYKGKTSSGHPVRFTVKQGRIYNMRSGVRISCLAIQGGGRPLGGADTFSYNGWLKAKRHNRFSFEDAVAFHFRAVTVNFDLWIKRRPRGVITGRMRKQYQFLVSKYPIGTFNVYSCLGGATFKARPVR
jgi:hypothetical protein